MNSKTWRQTNAIKYRMSASVILVAHIIFQSYFYHQSAIIITVDNQFYDNVSNKPAQIFSIKAKLVSLLCPSKPTRSRIFIINFYWHMALISKPSWYHSFALLNPHKK